MNIIVGLGNPGKKYEHARHNVGFMVVDRIVKETGHYWHTWRTHDTKESYPLKLKHLFVKPQTFMNRSGEAVKKVIASEKSERSNLGDRHVANTPRDDIVDRLWVIHDDLDLPLGTVRIKQGGSSAGHNGVQSIIDALGSDQFWRIRVGIGRPKIESTIKNHESRGMSDNSQDPTINYVLSPFGKGQKRLLDKVIEGTAQKVLSNLNRKSIVNETLHVS